MPTDLRSTTEEASLDEILKELELLTAEASRSALAAILHIQRAQIEARPTGEQATLFATTYGVACIAYCLVYRYSHSLQAWHAAYTLGTLTVVIAGAYILTSVRLDRTNRRENRVIRRAARDSILSIMDKPGFTLYQLDWEDFRKLEKLAKSDRLFRVRVQPLLDMGILDDNVDPEQLIEAESKWEQAHDRT